MGEVRSEAKNKNVLAGLLKKEILVVRFHGFPQKIMKWGVDKNGKKYGLSGAATHENMRGDRKMFHSYDFDPSESQMN